MGKIRSFLRKGVDGGTENIQEDLTSGKSGRAIDRKETIKESV
jgi:hypothetical protein